MEARGLIERTMCPDDNRSRLIRLTAAGESQAHAAHEVLGRAIRHSLEGALTDDQLIQLAAMTDAMLAHLERARMPLS